MGCVSCQVDPPHTVLSGLPKRDLELCFSANIRHLQIQRQSRKHYRPDGGEDHWATLAEVIENGGDDCDGMDLLTFQLLRRLGFGEEEIYRAIVVERGSGQHHMVTLWFEDGTSQDPFVLDPTGVVTPKVMLLSEIAEWEPIELFNETKHFRVEPFVSTHAVAGR